MLAFLVAVFSCLSLIHAQTMSHEEEIVRNSYAKLTLMCEIGALTDSIVFPADGAKLSEADIDLKVAESRPIYELSNFQVGDLSTIKDRPVTDFESRPADGQRILRIRGKGITYSDPASWTSNTSAVMHWDTVSMRWQKPDPHDLLDPRIRMSLFQTASVQELKADGSPPSPPKKVTYTRYAAFTVNASFQGESTGFYSAFFVFGADADGKQYLEAYDAISGEHDNVSLSSILSEPGYPEGFLRGSLREHPAIASWIRVNEVAASSCILAKENLCCSKGRCGISTEDFNRDLSTPLPWTKDGGGQQ